MMNGWYRIAVTVCTDAPGDTPPLKTEGFVPYAESPLAITRRCSFFRISGGTGAPKGWRLADPVEWVVLHRATGFDLGDLGWPIFEEAAAMLERCDPRFIAWGLVTDKEPSDALRACAVKVRMATQHA